MAFSRPAHPRVTLTVGCLLRKESNLMNTINRERIITALWFAIAGFIPAVALFRSFSLFTVESYVLYLGLPVLCAGVSGYGIGYHILHDTTTGKQAVLRILTFAVISYVMLAFAIAGRLGIKFGSNFARIFVLVLLGFPVMFRGNSPSSSYLAYWRVGCYLSTKPISKDYCL